ARFGEEGISNACCGSDFSADMRLETGFLRSEIKSRRAVNAVAVEKGHCRHRVFRACANKFFGQGSAIEEAECGACMKFDIHSDLPSREVANAASRLTLNRRLLRHTSDPCGRRSKSGRARRELQCPTPHDPTLWAATN